MSDQRWVYIFSKERTDGKKELKNLLGGKGANLAEMSSLGLPVPPGFTVTTEACLNYSKVGGQIGPKIKAQVLESIKYIEGQQNKKFGDSENPLLFSVRSGARVSMPGMMDTVLNLGLNDRSVQGLAKQGGDERFAWDSYRRFVTMYADVVMDVNISLLESLFEDLKEARNVTEDTELGVQDLKELVSVYKRTILEETGIQFPIDPYDQLWRAIGAVFQSWENPRAKKYREINKIPGDWGTAVNVQTMVFGNLGDDSATGVCFTRDPSTGDKKFFGEYLINAQGEDVVAGIRTPGPINKCSVNESNKGYPSLESVMPEAFNELTEVYKKLEKHYRDMQDIEFTVEKGDLYILQTRSGKRTTAAAVKIAVDMVDEGILSREESLFRVQPEDINQLLHPRLDPNAEKTTLVRGLPASPGAASGEIVFTSELSVEMKEWGKKTILVRQETSPEDIAGMASSEGILTARGGMTSHAAVVARGMGKPCVAGCQDLSINYENKTMTVKGEVFKEGDHITIDGGTGEVFKGIIPTVQASLTGEFSTFMSWADDVRKLEIRTNADNPEDSQLAVKFGAQGIGLCRTEHMFFAPERIMAVREMIFAETKEARTKALNKLLPFQRSDFKGIFKAMAGRPVNIRLLDPPLHEFLPQTDSDKAEFAKYLGIPLEEVKERAEQLHEFNPMLGHRGCRLGVTYPEIYQMQVRAIVEAAIECDEDGDLVKPEIMIPLVAVDGELSLLKQDSIQEIERVFKEKGKRIDYKIGTMIELPRAAITAGDIAKSADFFSFGTNDLTQTTFGLSRDDSGKFLPGYIERKVLGSDPFVSLDQKGVGFLVDHAVKEGRASNPGMHLGICGEHGGEPRSIDFCHRIGLDYVSCSPYRVPIARLAAAQSKLENDRKN